MTKAKNLINEYKISKYVEGLDDKIEFCASMFGVIEIFTEKDDSNYSEYKQVLIDLMNKPLDGINVNLLCDAVKVCCKLINTHTDNIINQKIKDYAYHLESLLY